MIINKRKRIWLLKLGGLTLSIYWFMTKGFTSTVGQEAGLSSISQPDNWQNMFSGTNGILTLSILIFFVVILIHDMNERKAKKPKSR